MIVRPYKADDLRDLVLQPGQAYLQPMLAGSDYARTLEQSDAWTGEEGGRVIGCAGVAEVWQGRGIAWALIAKDAGSRFVAIHRAVARYLSLTSLRRVEAWVDVEFPEAHRWMEMLGFRREGRMARFTPDGRDADLYAKVR
jgi:GNAT superfamily N-acetyltransferase